MYSALTFSLLHGGISSCQFLVLPLTSCCGEEPIYRFLCTALGMMGLAKKQAVVFYVS